MDDLKNKDYPSYAVQDSPYKKDSLTDKRTQFEHDISAIIYINAFKRLSLKSQIIVKPIRDHFRSRMTHTHEVIDNALAIGKGLKLNLNLIRAIGLAHDLGHTPFGHIGERTLREIIIRILKSKFKVDIKEEERNDYFNHSSNSARILDSIGDISLECINGALSHSWSPWKKLFEQSKRKKIKQSELPATQIDIPNTYEAQAVAISDQISSINHDIEDLISGEIYTNNNPKSLKEKILLKIMELNPKCNINMQPFITGINNSFITEEKKSSYGRKFRIENIINDIINENLKFLKHGAISYMDAPTKPLKLSSGWSLYLDIVETVIREIIHEESWFVSRDAMAEAMISVAFNHFWPKIKDKKMEDIIKADTLREIEKSSNDKRLAIEITNKYLEHFYEFCKDGYQYDSTDLKKKINERRKYTKTLWDKKIFDIIDSKYGNKTRDLLDNQKTLESIPYYDNAENLIALADFIAGLTDRYCIQIFSDLYKGFLTQG